MINFLVKRYIKDYENITDQQVRTAYGILASIIGISSNILLFILKLIIGIFSHSISVMGDAFNNLTDAASSVISLIGARMAGQPADKEHPFGHGRIEYISALIIAFLVIQVGFTLFKSSITKIRTPQIMEFSRASVFLLMVSIGVKIWMALLNKKLGETINSSVLKATSADSLGDVAITSATIFSLLIYAVFGYNVDGIIGLLVSLAVMWGGINIIKDTLGPLIGEPIDPKIYQKITEFVESFPQVIGSHDLIVHDYGPARNMASIHVEVPNELDIEDAHEAIDHIEREALRQMNLMLVIHMDPIETNNEKIQFFKPILAEILLEIDSRITYHDFRLVNGKEAVNLIFDVEIPHEYEKVQQEVLKETIIKMMAKKDERCHCIITMEKSFRKDS